MNKWTELITKLHIHPLLWFVMALGLMTGHIKALFCLMIIIFIHELGHAAAAVYFSWRIKGIFLLPFGGTLEVDEHGNRPLKEELSVIAAGPVQHIWLQCAAWVLSANALIGPEVFKMFTFYNITILMINLFPVWPLDGGKLLFLLFSRYIPYQKAQRMSLFASCIGCTFLIGLILLISPSQLSAWVLLIFLAVSLHNEYRNRHYAHIRFLLERYYGKEREVRLLSPITAHADERIYDVMLRFKRGCKHPIIIEKNGEKLSQLDENEVLHAYFADKRTTSSMEELLLVY
ncbi:M50 family metallopeptidase [Bacillus swezeyi]|uniref:Stage IV sporulation protein FB n=1 Tax=Bacillus swezeyi TaxID=1925020 RepID=A0A1R1QJE7_9BACI|nr:M50 family metallopeptidase [Bacillus swezeyi]MEC1262927.1 M50 family metallopeptidase [Bacillus swezeyi]MED2928214.1 M50 family metallopeptidase [Bacillus swezeyi]MED2940891.1 M50 family metallopeptidase [Bacillus swezeyi]MED2966329.1 M50 family metallopeptidase [Bacillus swezeyi]MED2975387.1 M50 family metallopeptidase [Bacillus swezeyi]